jgi:hypothetical protein
MKRSTKLALGMAAAATTGYMIYRLIHRYKATNRLKQVSDEGYETAPDVLYPRRKSGTGKVKYGPVYPSVK